MAISSRRSVQIPAVSDPYSRSERVTVGKLISRSDPFYPLAARKDRIEGTVTLRATIAPGGEVANVEFLEGPPLLGEAAMTAVKEWRYQPTLVDGHAVSTQDDITMVFRLP
jgi:periplasmic protein TonB